MELKFPYCSCQDSILGFCNLSSPKLIEVSIVCFSFGIYILYITLLFCSPSLLHFISKWVWAKNNWFGLFTLFLFFITWVFKLHPINPKSSLMVYSVNTEHNLFTLALHTFMFEHGCFDIYFSCFTAVSNPLEYCQQMHRRTHLNWTSTWKQ